ncbi:hypothetical protein BHM03_00001221, partial [Ensete ventricosum]
PSPTHNQITGDPDRAINPTIRRALVPQNPKRRGAPPLSYSTSVTVTSGCPDQAERVLGTLLGSVSDGVLEIKNSYAVPHSKSADQVCLIPCRISLHVGKLSFFLHLNLSSTCLAQVALDVVYHQNMYMSHRKVNPKEAIIGW